MKSNAQRYKEHFGKGNRKPSQKGGVAGPLAVIIACFIAGTVYAAGDKVDGLGEIQLYYQDIFIITMVVGCILFIGMMAGKSGNGKDHYHGHDEDEDDF